jgi:hypothetical protein
MIYIASDIIRDPFCYLHAKKHIIKDPFCYLYFKDDIIRDPLCDLQTHTSTKSYY